jgi:ethanolaminephosphotransferase
MDFVSSSVSLRFVAYPLVLTSFVSSRIISSGHAIPFTAIAQAPTVTLPRLKALTTGSNPTFLDAILNIAEDSTTAVLENVDSWLRQLAVGGESEGPRRSIVFAGDDTWLRLFPRAWFDWSEGVSSFFVAVRTGKTSTFSANSISLLQDTKTVDSNVTRHLDALLGDVPSPTDAFESSAPSSWDVLILHYLGLDHVGHLGGPESPPMAPKQVEMDGVVERIYRSLEQKDGTDGKRSLLVLVGDHGMTEVWASLAFPARSLIFLS